MIGKDFSKCGKEKFILDRVGNGDNYPYRGPVRVKSIDRRTLGVIDYYKNIHIQRTNGLLEVSFCSDNSRRALSEQPYSLSDKKSTSKGVDDDDDDDDDEIANETTARSAAGSDSASPGNSKASAKEAFGSQNFLDIVAEDVCPIPLTRNIACGDASDRIKIINRHEYFLDRMVCDAGDLTQISSIDCFKLGYEVFFCTSERGASQRIQLLTEGGKNVMEFGTEGSSLGQFRQISSISCFVPKVWTSQAVVRDPHHPAWFIGKGSLGDLYALLSDDPTPGKFYMSQREDDLHGFDLMYMPASTKSSKKEQVLIRQDEDGQYLNTAATGKEAEYFKCLNDLVKPLSYLKKTDDRRPFVSIAVADRDNVRVQILRYYWTDSCVYKPGIVFHCQLGGLGRQPSYLPLTDPISVSYSNHGELAICDLGAKTVYVLSQHLDVLFKVSMLFSNPSFNLRLRHTPQSQALFERLAHIVDKPCSVCFVGDDNKLVVGYKKGGLLVYRGYRSFDMGALCVLQETVLCQIAGFLEYSDVCSLRNSCRYLHNFTRRLRLYWKVSPMRSNIFPHAMDLYAHYARLKDGDAAKILPIVDEYNQDICLRYLKNNCPDARGSCRYSHGDPAFDLDELRYQECGVEYKCFLIICSQLFGVKFMWKNERYMEELFKAFAVERLWSQRRDPMTRKNEVIRTVVQESFLAIPFAPYLEVITVLEEEFCGAKSIAEHQLFHGKSASVYVPTDTYDLAEARIEDRLRQNRMDQYARGIDVPFSKPKYKRFIPVSLGEEAKHDISDPVKTHIETFKLQTNRASDLMLRLFK